MLSWVRVGGKVGSIRVLRVLRPLRTLHSLPGLKVLTTALLASLPALGNVAILLSFIYLVFAILGMELWRGAFNHRCRLTPFPVQLNFNASDAPNATAYPPDASYIAAVVANPLQYACNLTISGQLMPLNDTWFSPMNCFWPVDPLEANAVLCSPNIVTGRQCRPELTCGSNFDSFGNPRFADVWFNGSFVISPSQYDTFNDKLNYGYTTFDNVWSAFVVILQTVTASGWMVLTQMTQQAGGYVGGALYFNALLFIGMCFLLQLNMAVLYSEFVKAKDEQNLQAKVYVLPQLGYGLFVCSRRVRKRRRSAVSNFIHAATRKQIQMAMTSYSSQLHPTTKRRIKRARRWMRQLARLPLFQRTGLVVTVLNIITLASDHHPMDPRFSYYAQMLNFVFMWYFAFEVAIKLVGLGPSQYWSDLFNRFDLVTVLLGIVEIAVSPPTILKGVKGGSSASFFTALRAARAIKLTRAWKSLHKLMLAIGAAMGEILNFMFFLVLFLFVTSLLGMEFDGGNNPLPFNTSNPSARLHRSNFDSIEWAFFTVFQIITYDNFPAILYDGWLVAGWLAPLYVAFIIVIGAWIVMNMFSAILVESVLVDADDFVLYDVDSIISSNNDNEDSELNSSMASQSSSHLRLDGITSDVAKKYKLGHFPKLIALSRVRALRRVVRRYFKRASEPDLASSSPTSDHPSHPPIERRSLGLFAPQHPLRRFCVWLLQRPEFTWATTAAIATSCIFTALDTPLYEHSHGIGFVVEQSNKIFAVFFGFEMAINIVARGLLEGSDAYVRDPWGLLDGLIVVVSIVPLFVDDVDGLAGLQALRPARALRPLRVINKLPQLKVVINVLFKCIPDIGRALLFFVFMLLMFGIMSVMLFKGALASCSLSPYNYGTSDAAHTPPPWFPPAYPGPYRNVDLRSVDIMTYPQPWTNLSADQQVVLRPVWNATGCGPFTDDDVPTSKDICMCFAATHGTSWDPLVPQRFDNIFESMGALYELTTMEGWALVAIATIDAVGPDMQPIANNHPVLMVYWWVFMITCAFFTTNLFIGVLCESFVRENYGALVTEEQVAWVKMQRRVMVLSPHVRRCPPRHPWRQWCYRLVHHRYFDPVMTGATLLNTALMASQTYGQSEQVWQVLGNIYVVMAAVFAVEAGVKFSAWGRHYFDNRWHRLDFCVAVLTWLSIAVSQLGQIDLGLADSLVRVARVSRTLRLIRQTESLKVLFDTLTVSLPAVANVTSLLLLFYYIYAAVAVQLYATVALNHDQITDYQNFQTFWIAFQTLIGFSTGENWDTFLWQVYDTAPATNAQCESRKFDAAMCGFNTTDTCAPLDGCGSWTIVPFMYSFFLMLGYIGINLFSGIVVDAIGDSMAECPVNGHNLAEFADLWATYDPLATGLITADEFTDFLMALSPPFGFHGVDSMTRKRVVGVIGKAKGKRDKMREIGRVLDDLGVNKQLDDLWMKQRGAKDKVDVRWRAWSPSAVYTAKYVLTRFVRNTRARKAREALVKTNVPSPVDVAATTVQEPAVESPGAVVDPSTNTNSPPPSSSLLLQMSPTTSTETDTSGGKVHLGPLKMPSKFKSHVVVPVCDNPVVE
ncbi:hypothetical protein DYB38_002793 [Aphanomyces astaci]|uniref:EF-hand domain-containing protein n=1 Tax=Aphanomyces astaci TaxID=112090 RepID=A0A397DFN6_APHAT|nr:hypothetical protein DYB38_002793 [Aphanomyces astaci]